MNACPQWHDRLLDSVLGGVCARPPKLWRRRVSAVEEVEAHVETCSDCAASLAALRSGREQMDAALAQLLAGAEPSPVFRARVLAAVEAQPVRGAAQPAWVGALAGVAVVVLAGVLLHTQTQHSARLDVPNVSALTQWRSPTESLLHSPGHALLRSGPRLGDFYFPLKTPPDTGKGTQGGKDES